jgi:hypothetical protein
MHNFIIHTQMEFCFKNFDLKPVGLRNRACFLYERNIFVLPVLKYNV